MNQVVHIFEEAAAGLRTTVLFVALGVVIMPALYLESSKLML